VVATQELSVRVGDRDYRLRALADRLEAPDPLFGELWPVGVALAQWMATYDAAGKRVLEAGCGLALPSLVLKSRGVDVTAFDHHPAAGEFLEINTRANGLAPIPFRLGDWQSADLGRFDLVIGADLLYEPDHPAQVAAFLARHAAAGGEIIIADPGRRQLGKFRKAMAAQGRACHETPIAPRGRFLRFA
jgi:predicted nicotinamide N-methyase